MKIIMIKKTRAMPYGESKKSSNRLLMVFVSSLSGCSVMAVNMIQLTKKYVFWYENKVKIR
jgi:hypothetical protein